MTARSVTSNRSISKDIILTIKISTDQISSGKSKINPHNTLESKRQKIYHRIILHALRPQTTKKETPLLSFLLIFKTKIQKAIKNSQIRQNNISKKEPATFLKDHCSALIAKMKQWKKEICSPSGPKELPLP